MSALNTTVASPTGNVIVVNFPAAGTYPYELDYTACNSSPLSMTMALDPSTGKAAPPTSSLVVTPTTPASIAVGQTETLTITALNAAGSPIPNLSVTANVYGTVDRQWLTAMTNSSGQATVQYTQSSAATDNVQAIAYVDGIESVSNVVQVKWTGTGTGPTYVFTPQGWVGSPTIGTVVMGQIPITLASGVTLTSGTLKFFPTGNSSQVTTLNSNTTGTGPLTLGTFDGTLLSNGQYTIQLQATASDGTSKLNEIVVTVAGQNKPGRKTLTTTDLKIPLAGIPISITRTYDSLERSQVEDFGNGWKLDTNVGLAVDVQMNVTFSFNGNRQTFNFTPHSTGSSLFPWLLVPSYTPLPGVHGTLTSNGCGILTQVGGALLQDQSGVACVIGGNYSPTVYTYTDPSGRVYTITSAGQLQSIKDLNNNTILITPTGITSSVGGVSVAFVRDSQGRITQITDPSNNIYTYSYDSNGNLASVQFPGIGTPAAYTYSSDHLLENQTDPRGNTTINTYGTDGRLESTEDPLGNVTEYTYDLTANTVSTTFPDGGNTVQTNNAFGKPIKIVDGLNHVTTYTYDANQNLVSRTDPPNNKPTITTKYGYDANQFLSSTTDPVGYVSRQANNQYGEPTVLTDGVGNITAVAYDSNFNPISITDSIGQLAAMTYDSAGDLLTQTDANGKTTTYVYDVRGNRTKMTDPLNRVTSYTYDAMDRVLTKTDPRGYKTTYGYDALGRLTTTTDAMGGISRSSYDNNGNKTSDTDPRGAITSYTYDALNHLVTITYPDSTTREYTYDFRGNKLTETDQSGRTTQYVYDVAGELTKVTYAAGTPDTASVSYTYYNDGLKHTFTDENGHTSTYFYNESSDMGTVFDGAGIRVDYNYDGDNRVTAKGDALGTTQYTYDARGRVTVVTFPVLVQFTPSTTTQSTYDGVGHVLTSTDPAGLVTTNAYDNAGQLTSVTNAMSQQTSYGYDLNGNLTTITDANSHATSFEYDKLNHRTKRTLPLGQSETYAYDAAGNMTSKTDFNGKTTTYSYDGLNRLLTKVPDASLSQPTVTFSYTPTGQRATMDDASGSTTYGYDNRDRLNRKTTPEGTLSYTHDAHGNVASIASSHTNGASVSYNYTANNLLSKVTDNRLVALGSSTGITTYTYDGVNDLTGYTYPNTVKTTPVFDNWKRLTQIGSAKGTTTLSGYTYTLGFAGNRTQVVEPANSNLGVGLATVS